MKTSLRDIISFCFFVIAVVIVKFCFHELWKDEWQAWMVARDLSFSDMLAFLNYEGHPSLWYIYLKLWSFLALPDEMALQLAHLVVVIFIFYLLFIQFKMHWIFKIVIASSYFMFFEYGIVNRGYAFVILLGFITVDALRKNNILGLCIALFLLCQTEVYGVMIAIICLFYFSIRDLDELSYKNWIHYFQKLNIRPFIALAFGILIFVFLVYPRGNTDDFTRAYIQQLFTLDSTIASIQAIFGNTFGISIIADTKLFGVSFVGVAYSILAFIISIWILSDRSKLQWTWTLFVLGFFIFNISIFNGGVRHLGMAFIMYILIIELAEFNVDYRKPRFYLLLCLLLPSVLHNVRAIYEEIKFPFSNAEQTGLYIRKNIPQKVPVVAINKFETAPVGAYADRPLYELPSGDPFTYFKWLEKVYIPTEAELRLFARFKNVGGIVVLSPVPLDPMRFPNVQLGQVFDEKSIKRENYYLYTLSAY